MKISITVADSAVTKDGKGHGGLNLSVCNIPENVWALQWEDTSGHIEYNSALVQNDNITELPAWATACLLKWQEAEDAELAKEEASEPTIETFWSTYPLANVESVNRVLVKEYPGIVTERALDPYTVLKGIRVSIVSNGATALSSLDKLKNDCVALGVPSISDPLSSDTSANFITYMQGLGYQLSEANRLYFPWSGEIISNKADQDINIQRETDIENGVTWNGYTWQIDLVSRNNIMNQLTAITSNIYTQSNVTWRTKDNQDVTLTIEEFKQLATAVNNKIEEIYLASFNAKA